MRVVDVEPGTVGEDDIGQADVLVGELAGVGGLTGEVEASRVAQRILLLEVPAGASRPVHRRRVRVDDLGRGEHGIGVRVTGDGDPVLRLDAHHSPYGHAALLARRRSRPGATLKYRCLSGAYAVPVTALRDSAVPQSLERLCAGGEINYDIAPAWPERGKRPAADTSPGIRSRSAYYRYWPVLATVSMERPVSAPCFPVTSVRMKTIRSPFLPEILAQSSGLVVLGRSSFSLNSSTQACRR